MRIPVVAGQPQTVSATLDDQKTIIGQVGTVAYTNTDGGGSLTAGDSVTVSVNTTLTVSSGRGYAHILDVPGDDDDSVEATPEQRDRIVAAASAARSAAGQVE